MLFFGKFLSVIEGPLAKPRVIYLASNNQHKIQELKAMLKLDTIDIRPAKELAPDISWDETGTTFAANATIKALAVKQHTKAAVLADDSGLCVDHLKGAPGIYSSRFGGEEGNDDLNNKKLLEVLNGVPPAQRTAYFICTLIFIDEKGLSHTFEGRAPGSILEQGKGGHGFGYDPLFFYAPLKKTFAELNEHEKNTISHRALAVAKFKTLLT